MPKCGARGSPGTGGILVVHSRSLSSLHLTIVMVFSFLLHSNDTVEPLDPPAGCEPGERVFVEGYEQDATRGKVEN